MIEYYFQDQLRWSFGFENPNKAAALIASLLPFVWIMAQSGWRIKQPRLRWLFVLIGSGLLGTGWWLLFMTFSRGGVVAAAAGFLYIGWRERKVFAARRNRARLALALATAVGIAILFTGTNAADRSTQWITKREGSVDNRIELWRGGLQMIAQIPQGVGRGQSGLAYMQWFQPLESTARYRTLVNSYLTFATEQGLWIFGLALFASALFWRGTNVTAGEPRSHGLMTGCRASILAFAVAGFFTTTMEDWRIWVPPSLAATLLTWAAWRVYLSKSRSEWRHCLFRSAKEAVAVSVMVCIAIVAGGLAMTKKAPLRIAFHHHGEVQIAPAVKGQGRHYSVMVDEQVLGEDYGKLLRRLALNLHSTIRVQSAGTWSPDAVTAGETLVVTGDAAASLQPQRGRALVFIAPARIEPENAEELLQEAGSVFLLNPSFDEDGRVSFWKEMAGKAGGTGIHQRIRQRDLTGVGTEVVWAWKQIMDAMDGKEQEAQ